MIFSLIPNIEKLDIVLASMSPRRYEILKSLGLDFKVVASGIEEEMTNSGDPVWFTHKYAREKGEAVAALHPDELVISADTVVALENHIMGKPRSEQDAFYILSKLSGRTHQVYTAFGLFLKRYEKEFVNHMVTDVTFRDLTDEEIWAYINTGEAGDKAGAYGIQGQGSLLVKGIQGCFFNVVGFPIARFYIDLEAFLKDLAL